MLSETDRLKMATVWFIVNISWDNIYSFSHIKVSQLIIYKTDKIIFHQAIIHSKIIKTQINMISPKIGSKVASLYRHILAR